MSINDSEKKLAILCHFCGSQNHFHQQDLYESTEQNPKFKEKYCLTCGEPLIFECPSCSTRIRLDLNFSNYTPLNELEGFWDPTQSILDHQIPQLIDVMKNYSSLAEKLTLQDYRGNQKEFLANLPKLNTYLAEIFDLLKQIEITEENAEILKKKKKIGQEILNISTEIEEIKNSVDPELGLVDIKRDKKMIKKGLPFESIINNLNEFHNQLKILRDNQITQELDKLKPGFEKFKHFYKQNPKFFKVNCPVCATMIYKIQHQMVIKEKTESNLQIIGGTGEFYSNPQDSQDIQSKTIKFRVEVLISAQKEHYFEGKLSLVVEKDHSITVGRDLIREIEYQDVASEEVLFNEDDPFKRVSNSQLSLKLVDGFIFLYPMAFDEYRVGTYLNEYDHDIRLQNPDGLKIIPNNVIIIPLISKESQANQIKLTFLG